MIAIGLQTGPIFAQAAPGPIVIGEVNWAGSKTSTADEWIELANTGGDTINLAGWSLWTVVGEPKQLVSIQAGSIGSHGTFLLANNGPDYPFSLGTSTLATNPDVVESAISVSNSALQLELRDAAGSVVDVVGDGNKPFAGATEPVTSMERIVSPLGSGSIAASWRSSTSRDHLDGETSQQGTPTPSGMTVVPPTPVSQPSAASPSGDSSVPQSTIQAVVEGNVTGTIQVRGVVMVPEQLYTSRTIIISDGPWSAELSLPTASSIHLEQGDTVVLRAKVSRASTPRLLLGSDADLTKLGHDQVNPLTLADIDHPALFQLLKINGVAHPARGVLELAAQGYTFHVTRRQGVSLPTIQNQDTVTLTGLIVSLDPLDLRVLSAESVSVVPAGAVAIAGAASPSGGSDDQGGLQAATDVEVAAAQSTDQDQPVKEGIVSASMGESSPDTTPLLEPTVLGARSGHGQQPLEQVSFYTALISACAILTLLGDSLWIRLKHKQQL